ACWRCRFSWASADCTSWRALRSCDSISSTSCSISLPGSDILSMAALTFDDTSREMRSRMPMRSLYVINRRWARDSTAPMLGWARMPGLGTIEGQPRAVEILRAALHAGKLHHAYLFEGPEGAGKAATARALAMARQCESANPEARRDGCGVCGPC